VLLQPYPRIQVPIAAGRGRAQTGTCEIVMIQRQPNGTLSGSATLMVTIGAS
jgi:hypothetical protein